jgi:hypothetical protein
LSFFDEADEPQTRQRPASRRRPPSGGGRRPPGDQQAIQTRRAIAAVAALVILILVILGVHSCQVSARNSSLKDYNNNVASVIQQSNSTGTQLFGQLSQNAGGTGAGAGLEQQISQTAASAAKQLRAAEGFSVPDEVKPAQSNLLLALQMRHDGLINIAKEIQPALQTATSADAVKLIAAEMARLYASDVVYKDYALLELRNALTSALGTNNGEQQVTQQFVNDLRWLEPSYVATKLHATLPITPADCQSGKLYGHSLDSVAVAGTTLQTGSTNTIPASPPPKFTLSYTNGGSVNETNVKLKVSVSGTSVSGTATIPSTTAGATGTGDVTLSSAPPAGTYTVTATIEKVACEKNAANNSLSFPVTFQ